MEGHFPVEPIRRVPGQRADVWNRADVFRFFRGLGLQPSAKRSAS